MKKGTILAGLMTAAAISLLSLSAWASKETVSAADAADILSRLSDSSDSGGSVSGYDAALILQYVVGLIESLPDEKTPAIPMPEATVLPAAAETPEPSASPSTAAMPEASAAPIPTAEPISIPDATAEPADEPEPMPAGKTFDTLEPMPSETPISHAHTWVTETIPEVGHYENVFTGYEDGEPIYDTESVWIGSAAVCNVCGAEYTYAGGISDHQLETGHNGYHAKDLYETSVVIVGYEQVPVYSEKWVVDVPAGTRTYCAGCGLEK